MTFTWPYDTFAYKWMPFVLYNTHATFQRYTISIFSDMVEKYVKVFMDEEIMLGHRISKHGIEVDKVKIDTILKLSPPTSVKGVRSLLGHATFYRRFIKDF